MGMLPAVRAAEKRFADGDEFFEGRGFDPYGQRFQVFAAPCRDWAGAPSEGLPLADFGWVNRPSGIDDAAFETTRSHPRRRRNASSDDLRHSRGGAATRPRTIHASMSTPRKSLTTLRRRSI